MSSFFQPDVPMAGEGMTKKFAKRSAVISGMPATQQEIAVQNSRQDFNDRTAGIQRQAQADQSKADAQGLGSMVRLVALMQKQKQAQLQSGGDPMGAAQTNGPQDMAAYGVGAMGPQPAGPRAVPQGPPAYNPAGEDEALMALLQLFRGPYGYSNPIDPYGY